MLKLSEREINITDLIDVIEYELNWRKQAYQAEFEEKDKKIKSINKEIAKKDKENAKLKEILKENGIDF